MSRKKENKESANLVALVYLEELKHCNLAIRRWI